MSREYAKEGVKRHLEEKGSDATGCRTDVNPATWWARILDWSKDHREYFEGAD